MSGDRLDADWATGRATVVVRQPSHALHDEEVFLRTALGVAACATLMALGGWRLAAIVGLAIGFDLLRVRYAPLVLELDPSGLRLCAPPVVRVLERLGVRRPLAVGWSEVDRIERDADGLSLFASGRQLARVCLPPDRLRELELLVRQHHDAAGRRGEVAEVPRANLPGFRRSDRVEALGAEE